MTQAQVEPEVLHCQAVQVMLQPSGFPVYLGELEIPDSPPFPYLVAWSAAGEPIPGDERNAGYSGAISTRHQITIAGLAPLDVIGAAARVRGLLHRRRPVIAGRRCGDMAQEPGPQAVPVVDSTVAGPHGQRIYVAYSFFSLSSTLIRIP